MGTSSDEGDARREREGDGVVEHSRGYEMMMDDTCYVGWSFTSRA